MSPNGFSVSIVIPAYNEESRLPQSLRSIRSFASHNRCLHEVLVVDDGSRDRTADVTRQSSGPLPIRLIRYADNAGKGYAIRRGVMKAEGDVLLITDADLSTPIEELSRLLPLLERFDVVIGSRAIDESMVEVKQRWYRQAMGKTFNRLIRIMTGLPFGDTQCGFKLLRRNAARDIFALATVDRFAWDVEMLMIASRLGLTVAEVPVRWINSPESKVRVVRDSLRMLFDVIRMRLRLGSLAGAGSERNHE